MQTSINIDPQNGHVLFGLLEITPKTTISDLNSDFSASEEILVSVLGKKVPCKFAKSELSNGTINFSLSLRFESENLVSIFISLSDSSIPMQTQQDFYKSLQSIKLLNENWLKEQLDESYSSDRRYKWGVVGVAQDKSDNIYIYIHNRNNRWAVNP